MGRAPEFKGESKPVRVAIQTALQVKHLSTLLDTGFTIYAEAIGVQGGLVKRLKITYTLDNFFVEELSEERTQQHPNFTQDASQRTMPALREDGLGEDAAIQEKPDRGLLEKSTCVCVHEERDFALDFMAYQQTIESELEEPFEVKENGHTFEGDLLDRFIEYLEREESSESIAVFSEDIKNGDEFTQAFEQATVGLETIQSHAVRAGRFATQIAVEQRSAELVNFAQHVFQVWQQLSNQIWGQAVSIEAMYEAFPTMSATSFLENLGAIEAQGSGLEGVKLHLCDHPNQGDRHIVGGRLCTGIAFSRVLKAQSRPVDSASEHSSLVQPNFRPIAHQPVMPLGQLMQKISQPASAQDGKFIDRLRRQSLGDTSSVQQPEGEAIQAGTGEDGGTRKVRCSG